MNDTFGTITQYFIEGTVKKKSTCVLALVFFYKTRHKNATKSFRVLSCVIYTINERYVYIDYLVCQSKEFSGICIERKYLGNVLTNSWI